MPPASSSSMRCACGSRPCSPASAPDRRAASRYACLIPSHPSPLTAMPSFDIVSEVNQVEVRNALDQANKELATRFDFKGSDARIEHADKTLSLFADDDFKLSQVTDILTAKLAKRGVDVRALKFGTIERVSGNKVKQTVTVRVGIDQD